MSHGTSYIGLSCTMHDPALAIVDSRGEVLFAEATERYLQNKRAFNCPPDSMVRVNELIEGYCGINDLVVARTWRKGADEHALAVRALFARLGAAPDTPMSEGEHVVLQRYGFSGEGFEEAGPKYLLALHNCLEHSNPNSVEQCGLNLALRVKHSDLRKDRKLTFLEYDHHLTHAMCAARSSPFERAVVAVMDASGEGVANTFFEYDAGQLRPIAGDEDTGLGSVGFFYWHLCYACRFDPLKGEEWKVMGLAPYGKVDDRLYELMASMFEEQPLGLRLAPGYSKKLTELLRLRRSASSSPLEAADLARTGQQVFCDLSSRMLNELARLGLSDNLVLTGGCALNSAWNGRILSRTPFKALHVFSAPADDGNAIGAALLAQSEREGTYPAQAKQLTPFLGSAVSGEAIERFMIFGGFSNRRDPTLSLARQAASLIAQGKIVGWMQGRAEFGPRALGNRSILADPRNAEMKERLNARVKFREEFRPFAPAILDERGAEWFEDYQHTPYMERALRFREDAKRRVPAVVHVDGTGRLQSVRRNWNPLFHELISEFYALTGVPIVLNTSFNVMGKPIVHTVEDAIAVFFSSGLDVLVIEEVVILKQ